MSRSNCSLEGRSSIWKIRQFMASSNSSGTLFNVTFRVRFFILFYLFHTHYLSPMTHIMTANNDSKSTKLCKVTGTIVMDDLLALKTDKFHMYFYHITSIPEKGQQKKSIAAECSFFVSRPPNGKTQRGDLKYINRWRERVRLDASPSQPGYLSSILDSMSTPLVYPERGQMSIGQNVTFVLGDTTCQLVSHTRL